MYLVLICKNQINWICCYSCTFNESTRWILFQLIFFLFIIYFLWRHCSHRHQTLIHTRTQISNYSWDQLSFSHSLSLSMFRCTATCLPCTYARLEQISKRINQNNTNDEVCYIYSFRPSLYPFHSKSTCSIFFFFFVFNSNSLTFDKMKRNTTFSMSVMAFCTKKQTHT